MSDPYVTVEYEKDLFETNFCVQTLNPRWDEQITL
jgi:Ca2+-dependent lipid-binding protein